MPRSAFEGGREKLLRKATTYWKAVYIASRIGCLEWPSTIITLPQLNVAPRKFLAVQVNNLQDYFQAVIQQIAAGNDREKLWSTAVWLAERYDQWQLTQFHVMNLSTVWEFENRIGILTARRHGMDIPPYAEILLQGASDVGYRHPEYMLSRDLGFLYRLYLDADALMIRVTWKAPPEWAGSGKIQTFALGRAVIQTCFNLLESYVSGLARGFVMENEALDSTIRERLLDTTKGSLKDRVRRILKDVSNGRVVMDITQDPYRSLFEDIKPLRDSLVHCAPGPEADRYGRVKETCFTTSIRRMSGQL